jgi:hypothetical protein
MLRQKGCSSVLIPFPDDSTTKRTRPVFPSRQARLSAGWNSPVSQRCSCIVQMAPAVLPLHRVPPKGQPRRRSKCVSPTTARWYNSSTSAGMYRLPPALLLAYIVGGGVDRCSDTPGLETQCSLCGFGRDIKNSPIDQEISLPSTDTPASVSDCSAEVPVLLHQLPKPIQSTEGNVVRRTLQTGGLNN